MVTKSIVTTFTGQLSEGGRGGEHPWRRGCHLLVDLAHVRPGMVSKKCVGYLSGVLSLRSGGRWIELHPQNAILVPFKAWLSLVDKQSWHNIRE